MAQRGLAKVLWYDSLRVVCRLAAVVLANIRCRGREHVPLNGGALVLSNHQSFLDPALVGLACDRRLNYLARQSLFKVPGLRQLMESLDAIPIDREGSGLAGLKETLKRLKQDELVLIFPEGTRTPDGEVHRFKPGFCALARRAGVPLLPVALDGAFDSWPRWRPFPLPAVMHIEFGPPLWPAEIEQLDDQQLVAEIEARVRRCHAAAAAARQRAGGLRRSPAGHVCNALAGSSTGQ